MKLRAPRWILETLAPLALLSLALSPVSGFAKDLAKSGSISVKGLKEAEYANAAKVSLSDAVQAAIAHQPGKALSAELDDHGNSLVYEVSIAAADGKEFDVFIDAGNKEVLGVKQDT